MMALLLSAAGMGQCLQNVTFFDWKHTGDSVGPTWPGCNPTAPWVLNSTGTTLTTVCNTNFPKMFVGPDTLINVKITGKFRVNTNADDDYLGFVFGFQETWNHYWYNNNDSMHHEYYLFDWKKNGQTWSGYTALEGFSLNKVDSTFAKNIAHVFPSFWVHTNSAGFDVLQTQFSTTSGWTSFTTYEFELYYTPTRAVIKIDTVTIFDESGCFEPGLFGFYSYSQAGGVYWDFNYELFIDFDMEAQNVCLGDTARFLFIDSGACYSANTYTNLDTFYWDLGDGTITNDTNPVHYYDSAGGYDVMLIATDINGCTDTAWKLIYVHNDPIAQIGFESVCQGDSMFFGDSTYLPYGHISAWDWDFGDGNGDTTTGSPIHWYNSSGSFTVQLAVEDNAGCVDTTDTVVTVWPTPTPSFTIEDACDGNDVTLVDASVPALAGIQSWEWDMESNGSIDYIYSDTVQHTYATFGTYAAELIITDSIGCTDSLTQIVTVYPMPVADFEAPSVCFENATVFLDSSSVALGQINAWNWDHGDGTLGSGQNHSHTFPTSGQQQVQLKVTADGGCQDSITKNIFVYHLPVADFELADQCENLPATFVQTSTSMSGSIVRYAWDFGDGSTSTFASPDHDYDQAGPFTVMLEVETEHGCEDTAMKPIRIYPAPFAAFAWEQNVCEGDELPIIDQSTIDQVTPGGDAIVQWNWTVDQQQFNSQHITYTTTSDKILNVFLLVTSDQGCVDSARSFPEIYPMPESKWLAEVACNDRVTAFTDMSEISRGVVDQWHWDFGDGHVADSANPTHVYTQAGPYDVVLKVTSNRGCEHLYEKQVQVPETPRVDFEMTPPQGCAPLAGTAVNLTQLSIGELSYQWYVNDQLRSTEREPTLIVDNDTLVPKPVKVTLKATTDAGCKAQKVKEEAMWVLPSPRARFLIDDPSPHMFEPVIPFTNLSEHSVRWLWDFDDGKTSEEFSPAHEFENSGDYEVSLVAYNEYLCADTAWKFMHIEPMTTLYIPRAFTPNGDGDNDLFKIGGFNEGKSFNIRIWDRWGHLMFESNDMNFTWDGRTSDNKLAPIGVYVYEITMMTSSDAYKQVKGEFSIIR